MILRKKDIIERFGEDYYEEYKRKARERYHKKKNEISGQRKEKYKANVEERRKEQRLKRQERAAKQGRTVRTRTEIKRLGTYGPFIVNTVYGKSYNISATFNIPFEITESDCIALRKKELIRLRSNELVRNDIVVIDSVQQKRSKDYHLYVDVYVNMGGPVEMTVLTPIMDVIKGDVEEMLLAHTSAQPD